MPFISIGQLSKAIESLQGFHAFFGVTFLSMKQNGINVGAARAWGSPQEEVLLRKYFAPEGAPAGKPFFVPFKTAGDGGLWKNAKYSSGTLQRARTKDNFDKALRHPSKTEWAFDPAYVAVLTGLLPKAPGGSPRRIPVFDLVSWLYRTEDLPASAEEIESKFRTEFDLADDTEYTALFDPTHPALAQYLAPEPIEREAMLELIQGVPPGPELGARSEQDLLQHIETFIANQAKLALPPDFVRRFYAALKSQRFVVLAGRPGTGKTAFVRAFTGALETFFPGAVAFTELSIADQFSEADVLGYEKISGGLAATALSKKIFLSGRPRDIYVVLLDEMNLAQVDHYLARVLPALESDAPVVLPGIEEPKSLPSDTFLVGTANSFLDEPTRLPLSGPVKRRANVLDMPNALAEMVMSGNRALFEATCKNLLLQSKERISQRVVAGYGSVLDTFRLSGLSGAVLTESPALSDPYIGALWTMCSICAKSPRTSLTLGVVQDMLDYTAVSDGDVMHSLSEQVAQKLVPQLSGPGTVAEELLAFVETLHATDQKFSSAREALIELIATRDVGTGTVTYRY